MSIVKGFGAYSRTGGKVSYVHVNRRIREALMYIYGEYYRAYGNQDCQSNIGVIGNDDLPHFKVMIFKFLDTIVDDLEIFALKTPTLYRVFCFKDDVIFVIYLFQLWKYRNNKIVDQFKKKELEEDKKNK